MVVSMVATLILAWKFFNDFRKAFITMLIVGKVWAGILWAFGFDRDLFKIVFYNRLAGSRFEVTVSANEFIFMSFLATLVFTLLYPYIRREFEVGSWI